MDARMWLLAGFGMLAVQGGMSALPARAEPRPQASALRLSEAEVLARFTPDVRARRPLRERALALWRTHFAARAFELEGRFTTEEDWRPVLADAAALIDEFLEASLLPRQGEWRAEGQEGQAGKVWVETLDARTGQRVRTLRDPAPRVRLLAPVDGAGAKPDQPPQPGTRGLRPQPAATPSK